MPQNQLAAGWLPIPGGRVSTLQLQFVSSELSSVLGLFELGDGAPFGCGIIYPGQRLRAGDSFASCDGRFALALTEVGVLRLMQGSRQLWSVPTAAGTGAMVTLRTDGNLVLTGASGSEIWAAGAGSHPGARLQVQDDGNLVLLDVELRPLWASDTSALP